MMNQGPPPSGYRPAQLNGVDKGAQGHNMASPGSFPSQQFPSSNMSNGPQMNGPGTRSQSMNQQYGGYHQPPTQKMGSPYQNQPHIQPPAQQQGQKPAPTQQYQRPPHSSHSPHQFQQHPQEPRGAPAHQHTQPPQAQGMPPQGQAQRPPPPTQQQHRPSQMHPAQTSGPVQQVNQQFGNLQLNAPSQPNVSQPSMTSGWQQQQPQQYRGPPVSSMANSFNRPPGPPTGMHPPHPGMSALPTSRPGPLTGPQGVPPTNQAALHPAMGQSPAGRPGYPSQMPPTSYPGLQVSMSGPSFGAGSESSNSGPTSMGPGPVYSQATPSYGMSGPPSSAAGVPPGRNRRIYPGQSPTATDSPTGSMGMYQQSAPTGYPGAGPMGGMPPHSQGHMQQHRGMQPAPMPMNPMQQQKRIDPDQMPSPIQVMKDDNDLHKDTPFITNVRSRIPPLVTSNYAIQDNGNCSPRFMRSTMYNIPTNKDLLQACEIPLAAVVTAFADLPPTEAPLRIIETGASGPVRCNRCKAYINPFVQFIDGGRRFSCNICSYSSEVPGEYFCHLDHQGIRVDVYDRPELHLGSYEFIATADYCKDQKLPSPPAYVFMIDVSYQSIQCGMVRMLMREIKEMLNHLPKEHGQEHSSIKVGFVTYSTQLHFYNVKSSLAQPQMMVVSDVEDVFVPLVDGFLVDAQEARSVIDSLLEQIPAMFGDTRDTESILGPVVQAGLDALKSAGISGKLFVFHSSLPIGEAPGKLKNREDRKLLATEKEKTVLNPQTNFYEKLAQECVSNGVTVDLFLFPNAYIDVATIGSIATLTGGDVYRYSYFRESTHGEQFRGDLLRDIEKNIGFDAIMRLRCSTGLRPIDFWGNCYMSNTTDVELACVDPNKAIAIEIKHDDKLQEDSQAYFQCALLYTSISGQRRLRIHNLALATCSQLSELFRCCEMDTFVNVVSKQAVRQTYTSTPKAIRDSLIQQCATILACYRRHCASPSSAGQLILPECMKLLPLYMNCVIKNDALLGGSEMSSDDRSWLMRTVMAMDQNASVPFFYPRLLPLHDLDAESDGLPQAIRCSADRMLENGVYLLENGISLFMWIGLQVEPSWLQQVFGGSTIGQVDIEMTSLPVLDNPLSARIRGIIQQIRLQRKHYLKLTIVRQRDKLEGWFKHYLVEDKGPNTTANSYVDFLCVMHKEIRNQLN